MLAHSIVKSEGAEPAGYMLFLHGILGTRANWRGIARRLAAARPEWGAILVDLREHGDSLGQPPPHTLDAATADILELERELAVPVRGVLGHSFGGKVALRWLDLRGGNAEAWLIDSSPGAQTKSEAPTATASVISTLETLPSTWPTRDAFVASVVEAGQTNPIAQWLAMNLRQNPDGTRSFGPDLTAIRALMEDYAQSDLWPVVETKPAESSIHIVIGGRSQTFTTDARQRARTIAAKDEGVTAYVFEDSGHWVHIDATDKLVALLTSEAGTQRLA
ncbi:MAG: alpha/beta hydrolase [Myxococcota bacterium]